MLAQAFATLQAFTGSAQSAGPAAVERGAAPPGLALPLPGAALASAGPAAAPAFDIMAVPGLDIVSDAVDYWVDSTQRCILFWDCLRRSGNAFLGLEDDPAEPPQSIDESGIDLSKTHGVRVEALRTDEDVMLDPDKRPIVVFDPRAGTDAGAGELNETIRRSLYAGHCVYQASLDTEEGAATLSSAGLEAAEALILKRIAQKHAASASPPCRIGRCADMPRVAALALLAAECVGAEPVDAVPSSYWCGLDQASPYRNSGSLLGGQWLASLDRDLGDGRQDGSAAAAAPYVTDAVERLWAEPYGLYAGVDTAEEEYLRRARRRDAMFRRRADAARHCVGGPGLAGSSTPPGTMVLDDGSTIDLRTETRLLLLFATDFGRTSAVSFLAEQVRSAFGSVRAVREAGRVIVYARDAANGHLSVLIARGATQDGPQDAGTPRPGLFEMQSRLVPHPDAAGTPVQADVEIALIARSFRNEPLFQEPVSAPEPAVARAAERSRAMDWAYKIMLRPWIRLWPTRSLSEARRALHPARAVRAVLSDRNPVMTPIRRLAAQVREDRRPAAQDNDFLAAERALAQRLETVVAAICAMRDETLRTLYRLAFNNPIWLLAGR